MIKLDKQTSLRIAREGLDSASPSLYQMQALLLNKYALGDQIISRAVEINKRIYNKTIELYAVSYVSDSCINDCTYCGHNSTIDRPRLTLSEKELELDLTAVLKYGPVDLCILSGEDPRIQPDYFITVGNMAKQLGPSLERITFNIAPLATDKLQAIRNGIDFPLQFRIFQETYDPLIYKKYHTKGPKSNYTNRRYAQSRALDAGFDYVGIGALIGLNTVNEPAKYHGNDQEILKMIIHAHELELQSGSLPYSLSLPRLQPTCTSFIVPNPVDDLTYVLYHALLKIALPETKLIITCRETKEMRDILRPLVSIEDMATVPGVGGNYKTSTVIQNSLGDTRSTREIVQDIQVKGYKPIIYNI